MTFDLETGVQIIAGGVGTFLPILMFLGLFLLDYYGPTSVRRTM